MEIRVWRFQYYRDCGYTCNPHKFEIPALLFPCRVPVNPCKHLQCTKVFFFYFSVHWRGLCWPFESCQSSQFQSDILHENDWKDLLFHGTIAGIYENLGWCYFYWSRRLSRIPTIMIWCFLLQKSYVTFTTHKQRRCINHRNFYF